MAQAKIKKRFFKVSIPLIRKETDLQGYAVEDLEGRYIKYDLTRMLRGKSVMLQVKVVVKDGEATTIPKGIYLMPYYVKRLVRKGTNYVEDSFVTDAADVQITLKPFLVTRRKVSRAVRRALRNKAREELIKYSKTKAVEEIFQDVLIGKLQKILSSKLKKVYPLSVCEIRTIKVKEASDFGQVLEEMPSAEVTEEAKEVKEEATEAVGEKPKKEKKARDKKAKLPSSSDSTQSVERKKKVEAEAEEKAEEEAVEKE